MKYLLIGLILISNVALAVSPETMAIVKANRAALAENGPVIQVVEPEATVTYNEAYTIQALQQEYGFTQDDVDAATAVAIYCVALTDDYAVQDDCTDRLSAVYLEYYR